MSNSRRQTLAQAIAVSREMLELARQECWEGLEPLELKRRPLLEAGLGGDIAGNDKQDCIQAIKQIQQIDILILQLAESAKTDTQQSLSNLQRGKKAVSYYTNHE